MKFCIAFFFLSFKENNANSFLFPTLNDYLLLSWCGLSKYKEGLASFQSLSSKSALKYFLQKHEEYFLLRRIDNVLLSLFVYEILSDKCTWIHLFGPSLLTFCMKLISIDHKSQQRNNCFQPKAASDIIDPSFKGKKVTILASLESNLAVLPNRVVRRGKIKTNILPRFFFFNCHTK